MVKYHDMNGIILEILAFGVALFCLVDCLRNRSALYLPLPKGIVRKFKNPHFLYLALLISLIVSASTSVIQAVIERYSLHTGYFLSYFLIELYFIFHTAIAFLFTWYIINITGTASDKGRSFYLMLIAPIAVCELLILINPFTKLVFYIGDGLAYTRGDLIWVLYVLTGFYLVFSIVFFIINRRRISDLDRTAMYILLFITALGISIQGALYVTVELFFESIGFLGFLLLFESEKYKDITGKRGGKNRSIIIIVAAIFTTVVLMNISLIYQAGTDQTDRIGEIQLNNLKGELQQRISESEGYLLRYAMGLEQLAGDKADQRALEEYIKSQQDQYVSLTNGSCFSVYAASIDWTIIPGFDFGEDYHAVERIWYMGAAEDPGSVYISEPYIDADTGDLCYTFSYMLSDNNTVVAMDYTLADVQDIVSRMGTTEDEFAAIVTDDGKIIGCSEIGMQGSELSDSMPAYEGVFDRIKASNEHRSFRKTLGGKERIVFSSETNNGWILILSVDYSTFYSRIIDQMILLAAIDFLMVMVIIVFYMVSMNNQEKAESTLSATERFIASLSDDLRDPLNDIMKISGEATDDSAREALAGVREAGIILGEKMDNLFSYSNILKTGTAKDTEAYRKQHRKLSRSSRFTRNGVALILAGALIIGMALWAVVATRWGILRITDEADQYDHEVTRWMEQKENMIGMLSNVIAADPGVTDDYDKAVKWLDDIAKKYSDMTVIYLANPYNRQHPVIMNNGWVPGPVFVVESRQWYIDTMRSGTGSNISVPYFDAQTGVYCITFSKTVYSDDGRFLGVFAIDCLLDKLIDVLDDSYTADSYAFMVDQYGTIINHPYKEYEISADNSVNIEDTEYADAYHKGGMFMMKDYNGKLVSCYCKKSEMSGFSVVVVQNWWSVYSAIIIMSGLFVLMITVAIIVVVLMINRFIRWQEETNDRLVKAAETAVAGEKAKSRFLAQMSHEIRTPINAVLGMNEMILRESKDEATLDYAQNIKSAGRTLLSLINSILDFSKIEEGRMEIIPVKYDTAAVIESSVNSVSERAKNKGLVFEAHIDPTLPVSLYGDDLRITQVVSNLLTNAVKYTNEGRIDLFVDGKGTENDMIDIRIRVKDTGIGIKEEDLGKLFDSFTRLDETRNRNIEGTGLGMAIVGRLLDMMNSKLEVTSVYGEGSEFAFTVRQRIIDPHPIGDQDRKKKAGGESATEKYLYAKDAKVLVVDDNKMNLIVITSLLKQNGIKPDTVMSGAEALDKMSTNRYDVVMLDHMMPDMDGIETLEAAKRDGLIHEGMRTIALTANAVSGAREEYLEAGFDDYLSKPIDVAELEEVLARHLPEELVEYRTKEKKD